MQDGKHVILCIDDDRDILFALRTVLEANGYIMTEAVSAEEGLKVYKESNPDLIFVDMMMEEVDAGIGFVNELRALHNEAPIYMLSSLGDNLSITADYAAMGLSGVLQKPVAEDRMLAILQSKLA